jgi:hypothetical protein
MTVFSEIQAKEHLAAVLEEASAQGEVRIRRGDGQEYILRPIPMPLNGGAGLCPQKQRDLSDLAGTWVEDRAFDEAIADQDRIDPDLWK